MWIHTNKGFVSVVQHRDHHELLLVRARNRQDIKNVLGFDAEIDHTPQADYEWRTVVSKSDFGKIMADRIEDIDYDNFKNSVYQELGGQRAYICSNVWAELYQIQVMPNG